MALDVDLVNGFYSLCCGTRVAPARRTLPVQRFTWETNYLVEGIADGKDLSSTDKRCTSSRRTAASTAARSFLRSLRGKATPLASESVSDSDSDSDFEVHEVGPACVEPPNQQTIKAESADPEKRPRAKTEPELGNAANDSSRLARITTAIGSSLGVLADSHTAEDKLGDKDEVNLGDKDEVNRAQLVKEMMTAAQSLEGLVHKYPKTGRRTLAAPQERYFVALPELSDSHPPGSPSPLDTDIGTLSYWADRQEYLAQKQPKGVIPLRQIAQINYSKEMHEGCSVVLKHNYDRLGGDSDLCELQLIFPNKRAAEDWSYNLAEFLVKLRSLHGME